VRRRTASKSIGTVHLHLSAVRRGEGLRHGSRKEMRMP
jgi:hypothetical protein